MKQVEFEPVIIFSVFNKSFSDDDNLQTHSHVKNKLIKLNVNFKEVIGCYEGSSELVLIVPDDANGNNRLTVTNIAHSTNQESVLYRDKFGRATLDLIKVGLTKDLGYFVQATEAEAKAKNSWTYDPANKQYYVTTDNDSIINKTELNSLVELRQLLECANRTRQKALTTAKVESMIESASELLILARLLNDKPITDALDNVIKKFS